MKQLTNLDLIQAFRQGQVDLDEGGNCAAVALIKAAIEVFGLDNVFTQTKEENTFHIVFKNDTKVSFTQAELDRSIKAAGFANQATNFPDKTVRYNEIYQYATICFCAMVKKVMEIGEAGDGKGNFEDALEALNDGAVTEAIPALLGLEDHFIPNKRLMKANKPGIVAWSAQHAVYMSNGLWDKSGKPANVWLKYPNRIRIVG